MPIMDLQKSSHMIKQNNDTVNPASTAASGILCPTTPVSFTTTVNSSASTTVSTVTGSTTSFVTITGQPIPSVITTTLPAIEFNQPLRARNETIPYQAYKVASDFKSITSKRGFSNCGGIVDIDDFLALEFNRIPCFGAKNASPCTSDNVIESGDTFDESIAKKVGGFLIKYGYFSLIESLGGYAILTVQTGDNDPYLACAMAKVADDDTMADSLVSPSAETAYTATSAAVGVVCLALAAGGVVTVATVGTDAPPDNAYDGCDGGGVNGVNTYQGGGDGGGVNGVNTFQEGGVDGGGVNGVNTIKGEQFNIPQEDVPGIGDHPATETPSHIQYPSFYDFIFYTQSIIATGWLTLNLTSEYRKFTSTFSWAIAQGFINLNILVSAANNLRYNICGTILSTNTHATSAPGTCVDSENGYTLPPVGSNSSLTFSTNTSPPTSMAQTVKNPYGFDSYAHIIGIPVEDLPFVSIIGFLVVT
ncbi:13794_t:CDS:2, partial [Racocetra fulgida]